MNRVSRTLRAALLAVGGISAAWISIGNISGDRPLGANVPGALGLESAPPVEKTSPEPVADEPTGPGHVLIGDHSLRGDIDLSKARLDGDRYVVDLANGDKAILTLDPILQKAAVKTLARTHAPEAAIVVMSVDGRLLAYAGHREDSGKPAFDLPASVWAPAASVFKIVTAAALVDAGVKPTAKTCYHGGLRSVTDANLKDNPKRDGNCQDLGFAVAKSQNAIIAKLAHKHLKPDTLREAATRFGFETAADFALDCEPNRANVPSDPLEFARVAAGFWSTELSPLGGALVANTVAADGLMVTPRLIAEVVDKAGNSQPVVGRAPTRAISVDAAQSVAAMLTKTTEMGTAYKGFHDKKGRAFLGDVAVAGKTGSLSRTAPSYRAYSWFVGFAPAADPQVSISVLLGNSEKWHLKAHTAARLVLDEKF
jgi:cell division protein FtsI/penicillin-binding protein 2